MTHYKLAFIGFGNVARALARLLIRKQDVLKSQYNITFSATGIATLGALWAGQVFKYVGNVLPSGATAAPVVVQVFALRDTFMIVSVLIFIALLLSIWGLREERKSKQAA